MAQRQGGKFHQRRARRDLHRGGGPGHPRQRAPIRAAEIKTAEDAGDAEVLFHSQSSASSASSAVFIYGGRSPPGRMLRFLFLLSSASSASLAVFIYGGRSRPAGLSPGPSTSPEQIPAL